MLRIPNILPGSQLAVWVYDPNEVATKEVTVKVGQSGFLYGDNCTYNWSDVGATPREAIDNYIDKLQNTIRELHQESRKLEKYRNKNFPIHPRLSEDEFKKQYPFLHCSSQDEDYSPLELDAMNHAEECRQTKWDCPA
jgi:hypothetical protein